MIELICQEVEIKSCVRLPDNYLSSAPSYHP
jgi:hypothetical protein